ncbi:hypothetical protein MRS44_007867 [Fusarium solani]|uniref:uncharacterized protein n=1 Tax=Fusarium solani TaxID=169388 RepID=UPI0032C3D8F6|nr:hypothetical protein MRS44_007867 [Fusarium solani]
MPSKEFDPGEVINLMSSDDEAVPVSKKRSLDDAEGPNSHDSPSTTAPESKRLKTDLTATAGSEPAGVKAEDTQDAQVGEEGSRDADKAFSSKGNSSPQLGDQTEQSKPTGDSTGTNKSSTQASTPSESALESSGEIPVYKRGELSFQIPGLTGKQGSWLNRFKDWVRAFHGLNSEQSHAITPSLTQAAYANYIEHHAGLKPKKRRSAKQVAKEFESTGELAALLESLQPPKPKGPSQGTLDGWVAKQPNKETGRKRKHSRTSSISEGEIADDGDAANSESEVEYEPTLSKQEQGGEAASNTNEGASSSLDKGLANGNQASGAEQTPGSSNMHIAPIDTQRNVPSGSEALEQQRRYFPSATDPTQMCLLCGRSTHLAPSCPTLICSSCGSLEHADICCPSRQRCDKCRQLGHEAAHCTEKLALTKEEGLACAVCSSADHLEEHCTLLWRSFHPDALTIKKVVSIPASCSLCGSDMHFSADCKRRRDIVPNPTWSIENRDQYIDPECGLAAIEDTAGGLQTAKTTRAPELKIRGHAARTTNVHYSESDDSDVEFLGHRPIKQRAQLGQIRMASNIQMPQNGNSQNGRPGRGGRQNGAPVQPPLPPGPPPPGPPPPRTAYGQPPPPGVSSYGSQPSAPPPHFLENLPQGTTAMYPHHLSRAPVDSQTTATRLRGQGLEEVGVADAVDEEVVDEVGAGGNRAPF